MIASQVKYTVPTCEDSNAGTRCEVIGDVKAPPHSHIVTVDPDTLIALKAVITLTIELMIEN